MSSTIPDLLPQLPRSALDRTMTVLLAGGQGSRLFDLTARSSKAGLPLFETRKGPLRMVDFAMANAVRSGLSKLIAATQHGAVPLEPHLERRWSPLFPGDGLIIRNGFALCGPGGYGGTVGAVAANRALIDASGADEVLILPGHHVYQMDYSAMIAAHRASGAKATAAVLGDARMDVFVFDWAWLRAHLPAGASPLDLAGDIWPVAVADGLAQDYDLPAMAGQPAPYWRDVTDLDSLRETMLEFSSRAPCHLPVLPGAPFRLTGMSDTAWRGSGPVSGITETVLLPGARLLFGARIHRAIIAPGTEVPEDVEIGVDPVEDARWFRRSAGGTTLVTNAMLARRAGHALRHLRAPLLRAFELPPIAC